MERIFLKKTLIFTVSFFIVISAVVIPVYAAEDFVTAFFPHGKPAAPVHTYLDINDTAHSGSSGTVGNLWFTLTDEIVSLNSTIEQLIVLDEFAETCGVLDDVTVCIQFDVSMNGEDSWLYVPEWDSHGGDLGYDCAAQESSFNSSERIQATTTFDLCWEKTRAHFAQYIIKEDDHYLLDLENNTLFFRARFIVDYALTSAPSERLQLISDWSAISSVGKDGTQQTLTEPTDIPAPIVYGLGFDTAEGDDKTCLQFNVEFPEGTEHAQLYYLMHGNAGYSVGDLVCEINVNDKGWQSIALSDPSSLENGIRTTISEKDVKKENIILLRVRLEGEPFTSGWSNTIGTDGTNIAAAPESDFLTSPPIVVPVGGLSDGGDNGECPLCGICPVQPLGTCLFIWIAVGLAFIATAVVIIVKKKRK